MKNSVFPIELKTIIQEKDSINQLVEKTRTTNTVFAEINSVTQTEFFSAGRLGFQPSFKVTMYDFEYNNEPIVGYNGRLYSVYRTYAVNGTDRLELYLEERGGTKDEPSADDSSSEQP